MKAIRDRCPRSAGVGSLRDGIDADFAMPIEAAHAAGLVRLTWSRKRRQEARRQRHVLLVHDHDRAGFKDHLAGPVAECAVLADQ